MLSAPSQLLLRNQERFENGHWLLVNAPESAIFSQLANCHVSGFHQFFDVYEHCNLLGREHTFAAQLEEKQVYDGAVVYLPKSKAHLAMLLHNVAVALKPGATLLLVGENNAGIKSAGKLLQPYGNSIVKVDAAKHCGLFAVTIENSIPPFCLDQYLTWHDYTAAEVTFRIASLPGVFSHQALDAGTALLLESIEQIPGGNILDFACGAGVIGCFLAKRNPAIALTMTDINALALHCARLSAQENHTNARIYPSNGLKSVQGYFSAIFTNPPFHTGIKTDYAVTESFIRDAGEHLEASGQLTLVANRFLKYPDVLQSHFGNVETIGQTTKFSVYRSVKA